MTDKERGFLDYLVKRRQICTDNLYHYIDEVKAEKDPDRKQVLKNTINYHTGALDTYHDLIDAYIHTFSDQ